MNCVTPKIKAFAHELIDWETKSSVATGPAIPVAYRVCEKLRQPLSILAGNGGFRDLSARALTIAKAQVPALNTVQVDARGSFQGLEAIDPQSKTEAELILVANIVGLLVTFIGETLTLRVIHNAWQTTTDVLSFEKGKSS